jgi:ferric-dicitrate binding protein FerR (iron transport regulator)
VPSERFEALLADYLDGTIDAAGSAELAGEVERDPAAARDFEAAVGFEALLVAAHTEPPPESALAERVGRKAEPAPVLRPTSWGTRAAAVAAAAILIAAGIWAALQVFNSQPPPTIAKAPVPAPGAPNQVLAGKVLVDGVESAAAGIRNGARVEVLGEQPAEIQLADGSKAVLAPKSQAVLRGPVGEVRQVVELTSGKGDFKVEKEPRQFQVKTDLGSVTVTGTVFSVELRPREAKGEGEMKGKLGLVLAVTVMVGSVQVNYGGKDHSVNVGPTQVFGEEPKKETPKSTLPEGVVGFAGQVKGTVVAKVEGGMDFKVSEVLKVWDANKATDPKALAGMTIRVISPWVKVGDKMQQAGTRLAFIRKLQVGQEIPALEIRNTEREIFIITELTKEQAAWAREGQEGKKEEPKKEEPKKEESIVGKKFVLSDKAAEATFSGVIVGREKANLKIKIAESADKRLPAGETVIFFPSAMEKGEGGQWHVTRAYGEVIERLRAGDKVEGGAFFDEHPRLAYITVTARGEGEKRPERKEPEKRPEPPKSGGDEF